ncbi:MAG: hypothetical protein QOC82_472 [Frankiaceae bacterium]|nr:hypothetical protein [Frankiaceae bacterium]
MVDLWNSDAAATWSTTPERYDAMLGGLGDRVLQTAALNPGERVLDVGCGAGQLTLQAAEAVGPAGSVVGVDVAAHLVEAASRRAAQRGLTNVEVIEADAQDHPLPDGAFDVVISRFGVMFFADPVAAFANLLRATAAGGRLAFVCWQAAALNEWVLLAIGAILPHVEAPEMPPPDAPGPFAFADAERVRGLLEQAGWTDAEFEDVQTRLPIGGARTAEEAVAFTSEDTFGRLMLAKANADQRAAALAALLDAYRSHEDPEGVHANAAAWLVTARRPT